MHPRRHLPFLAGRWARGTSLLEILISLAVISLGLLGVGALQVTGLKSNRDAFFYSQAALLANDLAERVRANPTAAATYAMAMGSTHSATRNCETNRCTAVEMAHFDLNQWTSALSGQLSSAAGAVVFTAGTPNRLQVILRWQGMNGGNCSASGSAGSSYQCFRLTIDVP